ncbi:uncharacterized protein PRCAT00000952001 [Priceomyces carsonii]|uniref:uncharacterized protein n=1 Tax=Priceomyces carsonii TaxID=28549 RepID=UPI002ED78938|nr:unnamed protein product [Priceomyces carsonii]
MDLSCNGEGKFEHSLDCELNNILMENLQLTSGDSSNANCRKDSEVIGDNFSASDDYADSIFTLSPIRRPNIKLNDSRFNKVNEIINQLSTDDQTFENQVIQNLKSMQYRNSILRELKKLKIKKIEIPTLTINEDVSETNYIRLVEFNQELMKILFRINQEIDLFGFKKTRLVDKLITELFKNTNSYSSNTVLSGSLTSLHEKKLVPNNTYKLFDDCENTFDASFSDGRAELNFEEDYHKTHSLNDKENITQGSETEAGSPVKKNLQQLFMSKRLEREKKLQKISENLFADDAL